MATSEYLSSDEFRADAAEIVRALRIGRDSHSFDGPAIRAAVERCAVHARRAGCPPEQLIVALKALVRDEALPEIREWFQSVMMDRVVVWGIEAYYGIRGDNGVGSGA